MLKSLKIKNIAIVEDITVNFDDGLNIITGETGAGKSVITGSLSLILGMRADKSIIRTGETKCTVEATFSVDRNSPISAILDDAGIDWLEDDILVIRRVISKSDTKNIINDFSTSLNTLGRVGNYLIDMHGAHDHQSLLSPAFQLSITDSYAHIDITEYQKVYRELEELKSTKFRSFGDEHEKARRVDMLSFQVSEIFDADLQEDEEDELEQELSIVSNAQRIYELTSGIQQALTEDENSAFNSLSIARTMLKELVEISGENQDLLEEIQTAAIQAQEISSSIADFQNKTNLAPERMFELESRLSLIYSLKRKYGTSVQGVLEFGKKANEELQELLSLDKRIEELNRKIAKKKKELLIIAEDLSKKRKQAISKLEKEITDEIQDLGFNSGLLKISQTEISPSLTGIDSIDFSFAPNPGEDIRSLKAIASSGEISRVMLAIKAVLSEHDQIPTLVFDEIDANVGGEIGNAVGKKLNNISKNRQILCITHLPQVAVAGKHHFVVEKHIHNNRTQTTIRKLSDDTKKDEISRMLGGKKFTSFLEKS
ncbi:MAG: DNA repair protein RecN [Kiritimatiellae bacterium]|jgi:DNA repair protein RecN (Recombination protein N)|nr:DNA repair protein RecN [Kiritimatiellia bacterium]